MLVSQKEKERRLYEDYKALLADGRKATEAAQILTEKYYYCNVSSVFTVIRRCKQREENDGKR